MSDGQAPLSGDELLSAYLDGELSGADLARAEKLLEQPENRQLLADLKALGDELRGLPRARLGDDFAQRVIRKAERQVLAGSQKIAAIAEQRPAMLAAMESAPTAAVAKVPSRTRSKRPWIYAGAAMAAGLLIALVSWPQRPAEHGAAEHWTSELSRNESAPADALQQGPASHAPELRMPASAPSIAASPPPVASAAPGAVTTAAPALASAPAREVLPENVDQILDQLQAGNRLTLAQGQPLTVWSCVVSPDVLEHDTLRKLLERHELRMVEQESLVPPQDGQAADKNQLPASEPVRAVLVSGNLQQVEAALADIRSQSKTFRNLLNLGQQNTRSAVGGQAGESERAASADVLSKRKLAAAPRAKARDFGGEQPSRKAAADATHTAPPARLILQQEAPSELNLFLLRSVAPAEKP